MLVTDKTIHYEYFVNSMKGLPFKKNINKTTAVTKIDNKLNINPESTGKLIYELTRNKTKKAYIIMNFFQIIIICLGILYYYYTLYVVFNNISFLDLWIKKDMSLFLILLISFFNTIYIFYKIHRTINSLYQNSTKNKRDILETVISFFSLFSVFIYCIYVFLFNDYSNNENKFAYDVVGFGILALSYSYIYMHLKFEEKIKLINLGKINYYSNESYKMRGVYVEEYVYE